MVTGTASVTVTFLAQEIHRRAARQIPKANRGLLLVVPIICSMAFAACSDVAGTPGTHQAVNFQSALVGHVKTGDNVTSGPRLFVLSISRPMKLLLFVHTEFVIHQRVEFGTPKLSNHRLSPRFEPHPTHCFSYGVGLHFARIDWATLNRLDDQLREATLRASQWGHAHNPTTGRAVGDCCRSGTRND
jgi:hypothetical protein